MTLQLHLLGEARLVVQDRTVRLDRRTAAVLSYLALSGPTVKYRLAGLLWPESEEHTARGNMRQLLRRLKTAAGFEVIEGQEVIHLHPQLQVDALTRQEAHEADSLPQSLLEHQDYDDLPEFQEWLDSQREQMQQKALDRLLESARQALEAGQPLEALQLASKVILLDPCHEEATAVQMQAHLQRNEVGAAEKCLQRLTENLAALGLEVSAELGHLLHSWPITSDQVESRHGGRPPLLRGREQEWAWLEQAWEQHRIFFVTGEAGLGKSRLVTDFVHSHTRAVILKGQPADQQVPYATVRRIVRQLLTAVPRLQEPGALPVWVRQELRRLVPELLTQEGADAPLAAWDKLRFFDAQVELMREAAKDVGVLVFDDAQHADPATTELAIYIFARAVQEAAALPRFIDIYRQMDLPVAAAEAIERLVVDGLASVLEVKPLAPTDVGLLFEDLCCVSLTGNALQEVHRLVQGSPLYLSELAKHLHSVGWKEGPLPRDLPWQGSVGEVIEQRLETLSPLALQVVRVSALLQGEVHLEWVACALRQPAWQLMEVWSDLEKTGFLTGEAFSHDLVREAVVRHTPAGVQRELHLCLAEALQGSGADALRVAQHFQKGEAPLQAAEAYLQAAHQAFERFGLRAALEQAGQAAQLLEASGALEAAYEAHAGLIQKVWRHDLSQVQPEEMERLQKRVQTAEQQERFDVLHASWLLYGQQQAVQAEQEARQALDREPAQPEIRAELLCVLLECALAQRRGRDIQERVQQVLEALVFQHSDALLALQAMTLSVAYGIMSDFETAAIWVERSAELFEKLQDDYRAMTAWSYYTTVLERQGKWAEADAVREKLHHKLRRGLEVGSLQYLNAVCWAVSLTHRRMYRQALTQLQACQGLLQAGRHNSSTLDRAFANFYFAVGDLRSSEACIRRALENPDPQDAARELPWVLKSWIHFELGETEQAAFALSEGEKALKAAPFTYTLGLWHLIHGLHVRDGRQQEHLEQALHMAQRYNHPELLTTVLSARAELAFSEGRWEEALADSTGAYQRFMTHPPREDPARLLLMHHQVTKALRQPQAEQVLDYALHWLEKTSEEVPEEHLGHFWNRPSHRTLLQKASARLLPDRA
ncbi:ATP-binding protein [Deinococcus cellulosilyticus]|uniref:ATP-binding protein n=1 Tax=Deinococcus cellulosilyticus TaxID=401558 RepID=UPI00361AB50A